MWFSIPKVLRYKKELVYFCAAASVSFGIVSSSPWETQISIFTGKIRGMVSTATAHIITKSLYAHIIN